MKGELASTFVACFASENAPTVDQPIARRALPAVCGTAGIRRFRMTSTDRIATAKRALRTWAQELLHAVPVAIWRRLFPKVTISVCYHLVSDARPPHLKHYPVLSVAAFEADLAYLQREFGFTSYAQLARQQETGRSSRRNAVMLTFDDGFAECANIVAPILRKFKADCVFFVITDLIDNVALFRESEASLCIDEILRRPVDEICSVIGELGLADRLAEQPSVTDVALMRAGLLGADPRLLPMLRWLLTIDAAEVGMLRRLTTRLRVDPQLYLRQARPYLTTQQIRELCAAGFTIGAHGCSHRWLGGLSPADAEREIVESCRIIADLTGQSTAPFAFPYFGGGIDRAWLAQLRRQNEFIGLFFDTDGVRDDEPFVVQRIFGERFDGDHTLDDTLRQAWARRPAWRGRVARGTRRKRLEY